MKLKTGLIFVLILLTVCLIFTACKKEEDPSPDDGNGDDYSGSIAPEDGSGGTDDTTPETPIDEGDPNATYEISTAEELINKLKLKGTYVLKADIDLSDVEWKPVGTAKNPFSGTFDGGNFKITGFKITAATPASEGDVSLAFKYAYGGFFGVTENAVVKNVTFDSVNINVTLNTDETFIYAGAVAGYAKSSTFSDITVTNTTVKAKSGEYITCVGGLAGSMRKCTATACTLNTTLTADESLVDSTCGGLAGESAESTFTLCVSKGAVSSTAKYGKSYAGGLIGYCSSTQISKCVSASSVYATVSSYSAQTGKKGSASAGGFAAIVTAPSFNKRTEISDSYTADTCTVTAIGNKNATYAAGFAASSEYGIYTNCYSRSSVTAEASSEAVYAAGLIAYLLNQKDVSEATPYPYDTRITGCFSIGSITVKTNTEAYFIGTLIYSDLIIENEPYIFLSGYYEGSGIAINDKAPEDGNEKFQINGKEVSSAVYGNMTILKENYGWSGDIWQIKTGESFPTLKDIG